MEYIAVLDVGTSKMLAMVASKNDRQNILAMEQVESGDSIRRGLIYKTPEAFMKIAGLLRRLNVTLDSKGLPPLKQIYLGVGGQGLHTKMYSVKKNIEGEIVDDKTLDWLRDECQADWYPFELIEKISPEYYLDGHPKSQPQGIRCESLEARFQLILGHSSELKAEVEKALEKEYVELADTIVSPIATAQQVLTERDKARGCALVEWGAGVTYLSIYQSGLLRCLVTIPLGGKVITKDICSLDKTEAEAEKLKIDEGSAWVDDEADILNEIIEARANEIIANILRYVETSEYGKNLNAGFILTGGGSRLRGLDRLFEQQTDKPVRWVEENPEQSCALGMLKLAKENCGKEHINNKGKSRGIFGDVIRGDNSPKVSKPKPSKTHKTPKEPKTSKGGGFRGIFDDFADKLFNEETNTSNNS